MSDRQRRINSPVGKKIRELMNSALQDADQLPRASEVKAQIAVDFEGVPGINQAKLYETFVMFAKKGQRDSDGLLHRFDQRSHITELADQLVMRLDKHDRVLDLPDVASDEEISAVTDAATASLTPGWDAEAKERTALMDAAERRMFEIRRATS